MKKIIIWVAIILWLIILAWMYKFNYLSNLEWYDVDGNIIQDDSSEDLTNPTEWDNLPVDPAIIDEIAMMYPDIEGIDCVWNINQKDIACVLIDQINFEWSSKIVIFEIDEKLEIANKKEFIQKRGKTVNFVCGGNCYPSDFWFEWDGIFKYKWHEIISPDVIYTIEY